MGKLHECERNLIIPKKCNRPRKNSIPVIEENIKAGTSEENEIVEMTKEINGSDENIVTTEPSIKMQTRKQKQQMKRKKSTILGINVPFKLKKMCPLGDDPVSTIDPLFSMGDQKTSKGCSGCVSSENNNNDFQKECGRLHKRKTVRWAGGDQKLDELKEKSIILVTAKETPTEFSENIPLLCEEECSSQNLKKPKLQKSGKMNLKTRIKEKHGLQGNTLPMILGEETPIIFLENSYGVKMSSFDFSVENFFEALDTISLLSGMKREEGYEENIIAQFSSTTVFLKEWRDFYHEPKTINFSSKAESMTDVDVLSDISLPYFSSMIVPRVLKIFGKSQFVNYANDFVLHVGGPIWSLDWCTRDHSKMNSHIKCEYLAVSSHPPDSSYNKIGIPLSGNGAVQIWCLLNTHKEERSVPSQPKKRERRKTSRKTSSNKFQSSNLQFTEAQILSDSCVDSNLCLFPSEMRLEQFLQGDKSKGSFEIVATPSPLPEDILLPKLMFCLAHNGKVTWDTKWRPLICNGPNEDHHLGYLAVLLGDGSLEVWDVPHPNLVKIFYNSNQTEGIDPRFLKLKPVFKCSKISCGNRQSIPLTVEWSSTGSHDRILVGCHDGTVSLWRFSINSSSEDTKPLLRFIADSFPIRSVCWAPENDFLENENLIVTAGDGGLRFWDIRDPNLPLWDLNPIRRRVLSLDWISNLKCLALSLDDGSLRIISLFKAVNDVHVTGIPFSGTIYQGLISYQCSSFAIWSIHLSRFTGQVAYCGSDGCARHFELTKKALEKDRIRNRAPHLLCGSIAQESSSLIINISQTTTRAKSKTNSKRKHIEPSSNTDMIFFVGEEKENMEGNGNGTRGSNHLIPKIVEPFPPKIVAMHRIRWNMNKGSEKWLCYGGAAGILRCQEIDVSNSIGKSN